MMILIRISLNKYILDDRIRYIGDAQSDFGRTFLSYINIDDASIGASKLFVIIALRTAKAHFQHERMKE